jgi:hypothetical protein
VAGRVLLSFKARGGAIVVATQLDAGVATNDRVAILAGGRIVSADRPLSASKTRRLYDELAMGPGTAS